MASGIGSLNPAWRKVGPGEYATYSGDWSLVKVRSGAWRLTHHSDDDPVPTLVPQPNQHPMWGRMAEAMWHVSELVTGTHPRRPSAAGGSRTA